MTTILTLENGARVFVDPMPGLETAAVQIWHRAGAMAEAPEEHGVAHLLEHMAFKGTTRRTAKAIAEEIEQVGGYLNASTGYSRTGYYARILAGDLGVSFDILADILTDPLFAEEELAKEQEVVIQEIGEAADQPDDVVFEQLQSLAYRDHPLGRPILGTPESVASHGPPRLRAFMEKHYAPSNTVISVSGAVDVDAVEALARRHFGSIPARPALKNGAPATFVGGVAHDERDIEQTHIAVSFPGVSALEPTYYAMRVFVEALGGGMSSRLFQTIREDRGLAYSVYSIFDSFDAVGSVGAYVGTDEGNAVEAVRLIRRGFEAMASETTQVEINRARAMMKSSMMMAYENPASRADIAASDLFTYGAVKSPAELRERLDAVSVGDVRSAARAALANGAFALSIVGPGDASAIAAAAAGG